MPSWSEPSTRRRRTFAPVAISAAPYETSSFVDSRATRAAVSSFMTDTRESSSTSLSSHQPARTKSASSRLDRPARYDFDKGGRSYGGSCSRPTIRTDPEAPAERSSRAHDAAATPPPISRKSACRSATSGGAGRLAPRGEAGGGLFPAPPVEHGQHPVARPH